MSRFTRSVLLLAAAVPMSLPASTFINFETFPGGAVIPDSTVLTNQFPGITFTNTIVYNDLLSLPPALPPDSGENAASDDGGPISITFASPIASFSGYFTYFVALTMDAYGPTNNLVASESSAFSSNIAGGGGDPGSLPNELISVAFPSGISTVTITGDPDGTSFAMDDITYTGVQPSPEPATLGYSVLTALASLLVIARKRRAAILKP